MRMLRLLLWEKGDREAVDEELLWNYDTSSVSLRLPPSPTGEGFSILSLILQILLQVFLFLSIYRIFRKTIAEREGIVKHKCFRRFQETFLVFALGMRLKPPYFSSSLESKTE